MTTDSSGDDWLNPSFLTCTCCKAKLFSVEHSGFYDAWFLYCDRCANRAEVSFYDAVVSAAPPSARPEDRFQAVERRLRPCSCGGNFGFTCARRCPFCQAVVIEGPTSVDLWPDTYGIDLDAREPTPADERAVAAFEAQYIRSTNLWKSA